MCQHSFSYVQTMIYFKTKIKQIVSPIPGNILWQSVLKTDIFKRVYATNNVQLIPMDINGKLTGHSSFVNY